MAYAMVDDLEARWRTLSTAEKARATVLLGDASVRVDVECPPDADPPSDLEARKIVVCEMVKRAMAVGVDSVGVTSVQMGAGPYQQTQQFNNPTGDLYLTKTDRKLLRCGGAQAFTIDIAPDPASARWWDES